MKNKILYKWQSICSSNFNYDENCDLCNTGSWLFIPGIWLSKLLHKISPKIWIKFHNSKNRKKAFLNSFRNKKTGEKVNPFPNIK